ncbi:hypothetical protein HIM_01711 [Hirsutella minnesotensis 3608]|nr:hypothetical protein HIM_01711 [Hirsutella minnesotensis 3608]
MGTKRPLEDEDSQKSRGDQADDATGSLHDNKRQKHHGKSKHKAKEGTSEFAKKRVRNIERLLKRKQDLPDAVLKELERELATHKAEIADKAFQRKRSAMISRYHMVRFFERKKASRLVKQLRRQVEKSTDADDVAQLRRDLHTAEVDEAYTVYFPHVEPYVSLYGNAASQAANEADANDGKEPTAKVSLQGGRPPMWSVIEKAMEEGPEALTRLRERRTADSKGTDKKPSRQLPKAPAPKPDSGALKQSKPQGQASKEPKSTAKVNKIGSQPLLNRRERRKRMHQAKAEAGKSDEEDGGFFDNM